MHINLAQCNYSSMYRYNCIYPILSTVFKFEMLEYILKYFGQGIIPGAGKRMHQNSTGLGWQGAGTKGKDNFLLGITETSL